MEPTMLKDGEIVEDNAKMIPLDAPALDFQPTTPSSNNNLSFDPSRIVDTSNNNNNQTSKSFHSMGSTTLSPPLDDHCIKAQDLYMFRNLQPASENLFYQYAANRAAGMAAEPEESSTRPKRRNMRISKDPQSVAARHRRERISQKIRILQRLVPGGTKMDTASMLDEAINYVKFLKSQVQLLELLGFNNQVSCSNPSFYHLPLSIEHSPIH